MTRSLVLLSGGLDSTVVASRAKFEGHDVHALSFNYGQRHLRELDSARDVAHALGARSHTVLDLPVAAFRGSALTESGLSVPVMRSEDAMTASIPVTYVPARNIVFLSFALGVAEAIDANEIHIGANAVDYSGYPDCRPRFFEAFQRMADLGTKRGDEGRPVRICVPLQNMSKAEIVREGVRVAAPLALSWSCYQGGRSACGECDSCQLRLKGFREAGIADPVPYADRSVPAKSGASSIPR